MNRKNKFKGGRSKKSSSKNYENKKYRGKFRKFKKNSKDISKNLDMKLDDDVENEIKEPEVVIKYNDTWVLWSHELFDNDWSLDSYKKIFEFDTIGDFWKLYNNYGCLGGLNKKNYFLMRKGITPIWEDDKNRNGGTCSIKIPISKSMEVWTELSMYVVGETFYENLDKMACINGISVCPKSIWSIIKIWNSDASDDISQNLPPEFQEKYNKCSIKYKKNEAEY